MIPKIKQFLLDTQYRNMPPTAQSLGEPQPPLFQTFAGNRISLPTIDTLSIPKTTLHEAVLKRQSHRKFSQTPITLETLAYALWSTQGVKRIIEGRATLRTVPSAGARHAFETYVLVNFMTEIEAGLYVYDPQAHALVFVQAYEPLKDAVLKGCLGQKMIVEASVSFFWVADVARMTYRYGERGWRYLLLDAGHVCQNLYLIATALQAGTCAIGAFDDDLLNQALHLDLDQQAVLYAAPLGKLTDED